MMSIDRLGGLLQVRPGVARPATLTGTRPDWAAALACGRPAGALPALLGTLFSLCGHAHRLCAQAAVDAARGRDRPVAGGASTLHSETLREHARRILLDWPRLPGTMPIEGARQALHSCPVLRGNGDDAVLLQWIEHHLLGEPAHAWLAARELDPVRAWADWCARSRSWLARLMHDIRPFAEAPLAAGAPLHEHADDAGLRALAKALRDEAGFTRHPHVRGRRMETGCWTRLNDGAGVPANVWLRFGARIAELVRLALPCVPAGGGSLWLRSGCVALAPGEGLAWVEMARGLLVHHVLLDGVHDDARVLACHVLAPTEWNFHPDGPVARALETLPPAGTPDGERQVAVLMAAYDPCVRYDMPDLPPRREETLHA
jgi:hypothetical protein